MSVYPPKASDFAEFLTVKLSELNQSGTHWLPQRRGSPASPKVEAAATPASMAPSSITPAVTTADSWETIHTDLKDCMRCKLCKGRTNIVIGRGNLQAELMFIGEGPGRDEDKQGLPFVGRAGQLLDKIIAAMGFARDEVYIANIVKCRPPENRPPEPDEIATCSPFLQRQIALVRPKVLCALGSSAVQALLKTETRISQLRGHFQDFGGIPLMPTYHPAFLLRNPDMKRFVWEDVQKICAKLGRTPVSTPVNTPVNKG